MTYKISYWQMEGNLMSPRRINGLKMGNRNKSPACLQYCKLVEGWNEEKLRKITIGISYMPHLNCLLLCSQPKLKKQEQTKRGRKQVRKTTDKYVSYNVSNMEILKICSI